MVQKPPSYQKRDDAVNRAAKALTARDPLISANAVRCLLMAGTRASTFLRVPEVSGRRGEAEWLEVQAGIARNAMHITPARIVSSPTMLAGIAKCGNALTSQPERVGAIATTAARAGFVA